MRVWFNRAFSNIHAVLESIREADRAREFELIVSHDHPRFPGFLAADEYFLESTDLSGQNYVDFCLDSCKRLQIDVLAPAREAIVLAENASSFKSIGVALLNCASAGHLRALNDKASFYLNESKCAIPPPDFEAFDSAAAFDSAFERLRARHPVLCMKPARGVYGIGFRIIDEMRSGLDLLLKGFQYHVALSDLRRQLAQAKSFPVLLLMEYLNGLEYSADCVGDGSKLVACVQRLKAADGRYGQTIADVPEILLACEQLAQRYGLLGLFNVQFREGQRGLRLLEVNPRFSGGIGMSCAAGVNLPYIALKGGVHGFDDLAPCGPPEVGARVLEISRAICLNNRAR